MLHRTLPPWAALSATLSLAASAAGPAPEPATDAVLARLIEQSLAARPELAEARAAVRAERERVPQASALPDPMLQLGVQNDGFTGWEVGRMETSWYQVMVSQTIPWPAKLRLRGEVAELGVRQAAQRLARAGLSAEADVRRAYLDLLLARDRLALLQQLEAIWLQASSAARARYEAGQGAQSDVLRAQLELNRLKQRRWSLQAEAGAAVQALNRLRGHALGEPIETSTRLQDLVLPPLRDLEQDALARSPELAEARLAVDQARGSVELARQGPRPDLTVSAGVMPRGGDLPPMWLAGVGGPLPIFASSKQGRAAAEAEARATAAERRAEALEQQLRLRAAQRRTAMAAILETVGLYREGLLVQSETTAQSALAQYAVGKVTFASVLEANAGLIADEEGALAAVAQAHRLEIDSAEVSLGPLPGRPAEGMEAAAVPGAASEPASGM